MIKKLLVSLIIVFALFFSVSYMSPQPAFAVCDCDTATSQCNADCVDAIEGLPCTTKWDCSTVTSPNCSICTIIEFITNVLVVWIFGLGVIAAIIFLVIGAIRYITAGDDEKKITDAKGTIKWSILGFIIIILAAAIIRLIWLFFGFEEYRLFVIPTDDPEVIDCSRCM